jgi:hypothetical protein
MLIAEKKKEKNIAEYIIYIWQTEDLIRAYNFDIHSIENSIVQFLPIEENEKSETISWYNEIIDRMKTEGLEKKGHLKLTKDILSELEHIHHSLLEIIKDTEYHKIYDKAKENIRLFQILAKDYNFSEVEVCMNGLYGLLLLRIENKQIPTDLIDTIENFGEMMSYLAFKYREKNQGLWN